MRIPTVQQACNVTPQHIDTTTIESFLKTVQRLNKAIDNQKYHHVVEDTKFLLQNHFLEILDISACAHAMQGKPACALADAERMINHSPGLPAGYIRKGSIYSTYGHQRQAITAYDDGLQKAKHGQQEQHILCLTTGKEAAIKKRDSRVDYIAKLPIKIANSITSLLPKSATVSCLSVSKVWRKRTIECAEAWKHITADDTEEDIQLADNIQCFAGHVEHLKLNTTNIAVRTKYLQAVKDNHFKVIRSLELAACAAPVSRPYVILISNAISRVTDTLTSMTIEVGSDIHSITVAEILLSCASLSNLIYRTTSTMQALLGDFTMVSKSCELINLELKANTITGRHLEKTLQCCQKLRRLVINGCDISVLDPINRLSANLEILGYNSHDVYIPELQDKTTRNKTGLRMLYTNNGLYRTPGLASLIYKNRNTLETLFICLSDLTAQEIHLFDTCSIDFKLPRVTSLTLWPYASIQPYLLRLIAGTSSLKYLKAIAPADIHELAITLMDLRQPLETLSISYCSSIASRSTLISLFERYARLSESQKSLQCVVLRYCSQVSDSVLFALSGIKTLSDVTLCCLTHVTTQGIHKLISNLSDQLTRIELAQMDTITDDTMLVLGDLKNISYIELDGLKKVTDQGIRGLVDKKAECSTIAKLKVKMCTSITSECTQYAKQKVKVVVHNT